MKLTFKYISPILLLFVLANCNQTAKSEKTSEKQRQKIEMVTTYGTMVIELYNETPLHRDNFINLVTHKAYDSILFHRVIKDFMIQAGDPDSKQAKANDTIGEGDAPYKVAAEFDTKLFHKKGVLGAAREDNPAKASSAMQFYITKGKVFTDSTLRTTEKRINQEKAKAYFEKDPAKKTLIDSVLKGKNMLAYRNLMDSLLRLAQMEKNFKTYSIPKNQRAVYKTLGGTPHLDQSYTVFGEVIAGIEVLDSITNVKTGSMDRPIKDVRITTVRVLKR